jgi:ABC-type lipoprotein export system ATPase subunit/GNAT superfamily N-acetyltransferase
LRRREYFEIRRYARVYDKREGKFIINLSYKTATDITPRTIKVAEAFGIGTDEREFVIYDNVELKIGPRDIVYITGDSGSGKSVLLKAFKKDLGAEAVDMADVEFDPTKPLIDTVGKTFDEGLELLSRVGLNDAFLFVRRYGQLSDGQKYRYRLAKLIESGAQWWIMDEFCSTLDRDTAKIVAFNVQKIARKEGKAVIAATTHTDLSEDLKPSVHIHKRFGKEIEVSYYPNEINKTCSLTREMYVAEGSTQDYHRLSGFHYRDSRRVPAVQKVFALRRGDEVCGVILYKYPGITCQGRREALGRVLTIQELNRDLTTIARVVVHPKYRTIGLGTKLVKETLPLVDKPYVEMIAVMAKYNPFAEKAGMKKILVSEPNPAVLEAIEKLRKLGFNPVFLSSEKHNIRQLRALRAVSQVKTILKDLSKAVGIYRKRLWSSHKAYMSKEEFNNCVDGASLKKLAKMLRILGFLTQTKVYLFWKNPACSSENF